MLTHLSAHELKITLTLTKKTLSSIEDTNF